MNDDKLTVSLIAEAKEYWKNVFSEELERISLANQYIKSTNGFNEHSFKISGELFYKLEKITKSNDISIYTFLATVLKIQLYKYTSQSNLLIGIPVYFKSNKSETANKIIPFKTIIDENNTFKEQLIYEKNRLEEIYRYQIYSIDEIVRGKKIEDVNKGYSINVAMKNIHNIMHIDYMLSYENSEINFLIDKKDDCIDIELIYNVSLLNEEFILEFSEVYLKIFSEVILNLQIPLKNIDILPEEEKRKILVEFNDTKAEYQMDKTIYEIFEEQVEKAPDNIALVYEEKKLSYRELNIRANQLARVLREKGVGPDKIVGIMVERSLEMIVGIMGILKAGGAYLPIDPEYPVDRIEYMLEDSKTDILLTQTQLAGKIEFNGDIIYIDKEDLYVGDSSNLENMNTANDLAYVIYTSGSTGKPKGVMIKHQNVINFIVGITNRISMSKKDTMLALTTISFDIFLLETLLPLARGMKIVVVSNKAQKDAVELNNIIQKNDINIIQVTPSRVKLLTDNYKNLASLRKVEKLLIGGEALPGNLLEKLSELNSIEIFNMYGPTETTVWSTIAQIINGKAITIGKPIANTRIYIVSKNNKLQPIGVPGELCIAGDGLARGYFNRQDLTEEKFVQNPYEPGERMYKTGDLARWLPNGNIEFIGRIDHQVKIRGFRIELGEIESQLLKHEEIKEAVVVDKEDKEGNKYLCAYIIGSKEMTVTELREHLSKELPDYMVPTYFIQIETMPLTPNGKINRKALPEPESEINTGVKYAAPRNEIEEKIAKVWSQVLGIEKIGIDDDFFALGGHSLKALELASKLNSLNIPLKISDVDKYSTVRKISDFIRQEYPHVDIKEAAMDIVDNLAINNNSNIINGIISNDDKYSWKELNCFHKPIAIIFKYLKKEYFDLLLFNLSFYSSFIPDSELEGSVGDGAPDYFMKFYEKMLQKKFKIKINKMEYSTPDEMHQRIKESIDNNSPVVMPIDLLGLFYCSSYKKSSRVHYFIIKGYDTQRQIYNTLDNIHIDNGTGTVYKDFTARFDDTYEMNKLYFSNFHIKSAKPFFLTISNERVNEEYYNIYECILEHCDYLKQVNKDNSKIKYLEFELINILEQSYLEGNSDEKIQEFLDEVITRINFKAVYYDLIFKFLQELNVNTKTIMELQDIKSNIVANWNNVRLKILYNISRNNYDFKKIKELIPHNLEGEKAYRDKFIESVSELRQNL